jgi:hypothetical protein
MRKPRLKAIPKFRTEAEERRFWETHDVSRRQYSRSANEAATHLLGQIPNGHW